MWEAGFGSLYWMEGVVIRLQVRHVTLRPDIAASASGGAAAQRGIRTAVQRMEVALLNLCQQLDLRAALHDTEKGGLRCQSAGDVAMRQQFNSRP